MGDLQPPLDLSDTDDSGLPNPATTMMGPRRRCIAGMVAAIALLSFFIPLITTDTPVLGRTHWSPCQVLEGFVNGTLPVDLSLDPQQAHARRVMSVAFAVFGFPGEYCGLAVLLLAILFYPRARLVATLAVLIAGGVYASLRRPGDSTYQDGIYGQPPAFAHATAHCGANSVILLAAMGMVLLVAAWRDFEG